ncbi:DUF389 domain-containing protein, partial [Halobium palmae]
MDDGDGTRGRTRRAVLGAGALAGAHMGYERSVNQAVDGTFAEPAYDDVTLVGVQSQYGGWPGTTPNVTVTATRTTNTNHSSLAPTLERRIEDRTGRDVRVSVQYTESSTASA